MTVVTRYGTGFQDPAVKPADLLPTDAVAAHAHSLVSTVEVANGDSIASKVYFGKVPSNARLLVHSRLDHDAMTGVNSFSLGGQIPGSAAAPNAFMLNVDITAAGNKPALSVINIDSLHKAVWQLLGYAKDPGGEADIYGTLNAAATAAGTLTLTLLFGLAL